MKKNRIIKDSDSFVGVVLGLAFIKTIILQFLHLLLGADNSVIAVVVYGLLFVYLLYGLVKYTLINPRKIFYYLLILFAFFVCYLLGPHQCRVFYFDTDMLLSYFFYIPIALFLIPEIKKPLRVFDCIVSFRYVGILIASYMLFIGSYSSAEQDNYMEFSYALLPFVISAFYSAFNNSKKLDYGLYFLGIILMVYYGARTPLVISLLYPVVISFMGKWTIQNRKKRTIVIGCVLFVIMVFMFNASTIISALGRFGTNIGSYALAKLETNAFMDSAGRDLIYEKALDFLLQNIFKPYGLFSDRVYLDIIYVHNVFLELCFNFGFFVGGIISLVIIILIIKSIYKNWNSDAGYLIVFFFMAVFLRFLLSGSYLIEGMFFVFLSLLVRFKNKQI